VVFSSIYPIDSNEYRFLRQALEMYELNDASLSYQKNSSAAVDSLSLIVFLNTMCRSSRIRCSKT